MAQDDSIERWRPVVAYGGVYEETYEVSSIGRVRRTSGRPVPLSYPRVTLGHDGLALERMVHILVATAFLGPRPKGHVVNHIDGDKTNAALSNLEYTTQSANIQHAQDTGLIVRNTGDRHHLTKYSEAEKAQWRARYAAGETMRAISRSVGASFETVWRTVAGKHRKPRRRHVP